MRCRHCRPVEPEVWAVVGTGCGSVAYRCAEATRLAHSRIEIYVSAALRVFMAESSRT